MRSVRTSDGYVFFESSIGWVDSIKPDGTPYQLDILMDDETMQEWIDDGDAYVYEWSDEWTPLYEGPFNSEQEALDYRRWEVNRIMPTRIRSIVNKADSKTIWFIDCQREVTA